MRKGLRVKKVKQTKRMESSVVMQVILLFSFAFHKNSLQTSWFIADESRNLYQDFEKDEISELLILLRENVLLKLQEDNTIELIDK